MTIETLVPAGIAEGYDKAAMIVKHANTHRTTLKQAALALGYVTEMQYDAWVVPAEMIHPNA